MQDAPSTVTHAIPAGYLAEVATTLEMRAPPADVAPPPHADGLSLKRVAKPTIEWHRSIFRAVGEEWLWDSRLRLSDVQLRAVLEDERVESYAPMRDGREIGLLELDFREQGACELTFFGLMREGIGTGAGSWLMRHAIARAWSQPITRFWVHTCTLDHPRALGFYRRWGFVAVSRHIEIFPDPRLAGRYPRDAAPQIPLIEG